MKAKRMIKVMPRDSVREATVVYQSITKNEKENMAISFGSTSSYAPCYY